MNGGRGGAGRPHGDVRLALRRAAQLAPGTVRELAYRAQVSVQHAHVTVSRMVDAGELVVLGGSRPSVLAWPAAAAAARHGAMRTLQAARSSAAAAHVAGDAPGSFDDL